MSLHILLVEDNPENREMLGRRLTRRGYRLSEAVPNGVSKYVPQHAGFGGIPVRDEIRLEKHLE